MGRTTDASATGSQSSPRIRAVLGALLLGVAINLAQFVHLERGLEPTWRAFTRAADADLAAVAAERDEATVIERQFGLVLALREHAPRHRLIVPDDLTLTGAISLELLTGLGTVVCVEPQALDQRALAAQLPSARSAAEWGRLGAGSNTFALFVTESDSRTIVLLDLRDRANQVVLIDAGLLPSELRPTPTC